MGETIYLLAMSAVCLLLFSIGLTVFLKNTKLHLNRIFFIFTLVAVAWIVTNYLSNSITLSYTVVLVNNHLVFFFAFLAVALLLNFIAELTGKTSNKALVHLSSVVTVALSLTALTPLIVQDIHRQGNVYAIDFGPLLLLFGIYLIGMVVVMFTILIRARHRAIGQEYRQLTVLQHSLLLGLILLLAMNFIIPTVFGWFLLTQVGIFATLIFEGGMLYVIAKHRLFDIKFVVVRALGYILAIATLVGLYSVVIIAILRYALNLKMEVWQEIILLIGVAIAGIFFQPLRNFFNQLTSRVFYRDAYDPQVLYDRLNRLLVSSIDIEYMLRHSAEIITDTLRPEYCIIMIDDARGTRAFGSKHVKFDPSGLQIIKKNAIRIRQKIIVTDYLDRLSDQELKTELISNNIAALVKLLQKTHETTDLKGYILLGAKKTGTPYNQDDERTLEAVSNELVLAIQNALHFEEIQQFNETLQVRVNEATRKLKASNEKLRKMDETKDEFISMASHQLRTPLTSVKGYVSMVLDGDVGPINEQQRELLNQSFSSSQRMANLISDLLNLSRINTGKFVIEPSQVYLPKVVEVELGQLREMAQGKNVTLKLDMPATFPTLMLDENKMHQVVMNLIDNAIYYTPEGGTVTVQLSETPTAVEFRVIDTGIGVPKDAQHRLFTKMFRAENAQRARPDGTGLGLFLVKKVIVSQGGAIIFDSVEGKGSTFGFHFNKKDHEIDKINTTDPSVQAEATSVA